MKQGTLKAKGAAEKQEKDIFASDDSEEDEDYVPPVEKNPEVVAEKEDAAEDSSEGVTGVEALKRKRR